MKELLIQIANILFDVPKMNRNRMIGIMNPLKNINQAQEMLDYLKSNFNNMELMRIDNLLMKALEIGG